MKIEKIAQELHRFESHGPVPHWNPFSTNFISNPMFLGALNSVVTSVSQFETLSRKSPLKVSLRDPETTLEATG